jgi:peptide-methionine (R)-S-oxide reductase
MKTKIILSLLGVFLFFSFVQNQEPKKQEPSSQKIIKTDAEWRKILTPEQYVILRQKGTEPSCSGKLLDNKEKGVYVCAGCGLELFDSKAKFNSKTGWPSFYASLKKENVTEKPDNSYGMIRTEINCGRCDGHLGHVFDDGPQPTGMRFCVNSASLKFVKKP